MYNASLLLAVSAPTLAEFLCHAHVEQFLFPPQLIIRAILRLKPPELPFVLCPVYVNIVAIQHLPRSAAPLELLAALLQPCDLATRLIIAILRSHIAPSIILACHVVHLRSFYLCKFTIDQLVPCIRLDTFPVYDLCFHRYGLIFIANLFPLCKHDYGVYPGFCP